MFEVIHERCCGLDVHKKTVVACLMTPGSKQVRTFGTTTEAIRELKTWLQEAGCTHVAMESTGVYWKPIYNLLEDSGMTVILANPQRIKAIPGRKTDMKDAEWIAGLLSRDMVPASFVPDRAGREYRELVRYRRSLVEERTRTKNRIRKVLEGANLKLGSVVSDIDGKTSRAILAALEAGVTDPAALAKLADGRIRATPEELRAALEGAVGPHQRLLLASLNRVLASLDAEIARLDAEIEERSRPFEQQVRALDGIPGVGRETAQEIIAAIGTDMSRFPSAGHVASWARLCPGTHESAGKRSSARIGAGNRHLRAALVEAAHAAGRCRNTYLAAQYQRLRVRIGAKKAAVAVAHSILVIAYHLMRDGVLYTDLGANYFLERDADAAKHRALRTLDRLGYEATLTPKPQQEATRQPDEAAIRTPTEDQAAA